MILALERGRQIFILRKGGLAESHRGFELAHPEFALYPTWEHQQREQLRPEYRGWFDALERAEDASVTVTSWARAAEVIEAPADGAAWASVEQQHVWTPDYIRMRSEYRPDLPLRIVLLRAFRLRAPAEIPYDRRYRGCRSWVELQTEVEVAESVPVLDEGAFKRSREALLTGLGIAAKT